MRHELETRLTAVPEMEPAGQLVGELAHDINDLLTVISGSALRLRAGSELSDTTEALAQISCAAQRAAELTRQLLTLGGTPAELMFIDLAEAIRRLEPTIRLLLAGDIVLDFRHYQPAPAVLMEPARFEQILMNLIMNASDAMAQGGTLTVSTQPRDVSALQAKRRGIAAGSYVLMSVSDTGAGIESKARDRIFDPLFTTKSGTATGMGLTSVRGAVEHAGGRIDVDSERGRGTTFHVLLPEAAAAPPTDRTSWASVSGGTVSCSSPDTGMATLSSLGPGRRW